MAKRRPRRSSSTVGSKAIIWLACIVFTAVVFEVTLTEAERHPGAAGAVAFLVAAGSGIGGICWWRNRQAALAAAEVDRLHRQQIRLAQSQEITRYHGMTSKEFEKALAFLCERDGCTNVRVVGGANDLGADVIATTPDGRTLVLQAKRYARGRSVGSQAVQVVNGTYRHEHGAHLAAIVTTGVFTKPAREYAERTGIRLVDEQALAAWASRTGPAPWHESQMM